MTFFEAAEILKQCDRFDAASTVHKDISFQWHRTGEKPGASTPVAAGLRTATGGYVNFYEAIDGAEVKKVEFQGAMARMLMHLGTSMESAWECEECQEMYAAPAPADRICWTCAAKNLGSQSAK